MRILVLTPTFLPTVGGAEILLLEVYRRLAERHKVCLVTPDKNLPKSHYDDLVNFAVIRYRDRFNSMHLRGHRLTGGFVPPFSLSAVAATRSMILDFRPTVLNTHYTVSTGLATVVARKAYGLPSVLSLIGRDVPGPGTPWFWRYYHRWVGRSASRVTFISAYCRRAIYGRDSCVGRVIPGGVDLQRFSPEVDGSHIRQRLGIPPATPVLVSVQRLSPEKRVDTIIKSMPQVLVKHPSTRLVIGGKGPTRSSLVSLVEDLNLSHSVHFAGFISEADLPAYYAMADIFVFHSTYETFGIVLAEALASGKPVVSVRSTAIPDVVQDSVTGLLAAPLDPLDLADKVTHLLDSPTKMEEFGRRAHIWAEKHFGWDRIADRYEAVLAEAAGT